METCEIKDYNHFVELTRQFDSTYGTKTYMIRMTLKEINDTFLHRDHKTMKEQYTNQHHSTPNYKLYSFYKMIQDLNNGEPIKHPVNLHYFGKDKVGIHPGNTRIMFDDYYDGIMDVIMTDYIGDLYKVYPNKYIALEDAYFDTDELTMLFSRCEHDTPKSICPGSIRKMISRPTEIKQCVHLQSGVEWANPPKHNIVNTGDKVFLDDYLVMYKEHDEWHFNIKDRK
jgi:hypothetical protein